MGANEFVFGFDFVVTDVVFVVCDGVGRVEAADFAEVFVSAGMPLIRASPLKH